MINNKLNKTKEYILNPSALSYLCYHCEYMKQNYDLYNSSISAGITQTLDGIQKKYFLGDSTKIDKKLKDGETIDPYNVTFFSKLLYKALLPGELIASGTSLDCPILVCFANSAVFLR